jgi:NAD(P)-dependent dehydrogenase (short-subunit alcohol dehydrogenase family)
MKTILITGTTSGVGATIAYDYIEKGWNVIGLARGESLFNYPNYKHYQADISKIYTSLSDTFDEIGNTKIDILVNNAAVFKMKSFSETSIEEICDMIDINLKGAMYVTKFALKNMEKGSRIFFINSVAGLEELENQSVYCASKHGLTGFAGVLGKELQPRGIKVTSIHPGGIDTPLWNKEIPYPCGDVSKAISPIELVKLIDFVYNSKFNIEYKTIKMFPDTEWHQ